MCVSLCSQISLKSEDYGKHLLGVQDLLQKHSLTEADITTQTDRAKALKARELFMLICDLLTVLSSQYLLYVYVTLHP